MERLDTYRQAIKRLLEDYAKLSADDKEIETNKLRNWDSLEPEEQTRIRFENVSSTMPNFRIDFGKLSSHTHV